MDESVIRILKALADENRLQIMRHLGQRSVCVCEMESLLAMSQPAVSHHLKVLREAGLVSTTRQGKWIFYSLDKEKFVSFMESLAALTTNEAISFPTDDVFEICRACDREGN